MTKLRFMRIATIALGAQTIAGAALSAWPRAERIVLNEAQLQERINRELPRPFRGVTVERVIVSLADGRISLRVEACAFGKAFPVTPARGVPRYDAERGEIFFDAEDSGLENFSIGDLLKQLGSCKEIQQNLPRVEAFPPASSGN